MYLLALYPWSSIRRQMAPSKGQIFICDNFKNILLRLLKFGMYVSMATDSKAIVLWPSSATERPTAAFGLFG